MDQNSQQYESVFTKKVKAGRRRTYFIDVRQTKGEDYYITLTESTKKFNGSGYERHKIFLYKEDFNRFLESLTESIDHIKTELLPDYDYDEYTRRNQEWEEKRRLEAEEQADQEANSTENPELPAEDAVADGAIAEEKAPDAMGDETSTAEEESSPKEVDSEEDMEW